MEEKYEQLKEDVLDEIEEIEQVLKDLSSLNNNLVPDKIDKLPARLAQVPHYIL